MEEERYLHHRGKERLARPPRCFIRADNLKPIHVGESERERERAKRTMAASTTFFLLIICTALTAVAPSSPPASNPNPLNISAVFAFGDSILDTGNNNAFPTTVRANHPPYGINFPGQVATGRFSDGRLIPDLLVSSLGIGDRVPAYMGGSLTGKDFPGAGVCFASAGSGLDDLTSTSTGVLTINRQVGNFREYLQKLQ